MSKRLEVTIDLRGAAFHDDIAGFEIAAILRRIANDFADGWGGQYVPNEANPEAVEVRESNGNVCGFVQIVDYGKLG